MESVGKAFTFVFDDEKWVSKVLIGSLFTFLSLLLIGLPFVSGYLLQLIRNVIEGKARPLPEWDKLGEMFSQGLIFLIIVFIYSIPGLIFYCGSFAIAMVFFVSSSRIGDNSVLPLLGMLIMYGGMFLSFVYSMVFYLLLPSITIKFAINQRFGEAFHLEEHFRFIKANLGNYLVTILLVFATEYFIAQIGFLVCIIGYFVTAFYATLVAGHLFGQLYLASVAKQGGENGSFQP